jgi:FlaA1/EpsC-like NDP-sugar epimerase
VRKADTAYERQGQNRSHEEGLIIDAGRNAAGSSDPAHRRRLLARIVADAAAWCVTITFATVLRYEFAVSSPLWGRVAAMIAVTAATQTAVGFMTGLYRGRRRTGSFDEVTVLATTAFWTTLIVTDVNLLSGPARLVPLSATLLGGSTALALQAGTRWAWRAAAERRLRPATAGAVKLLVFGAGESAAFILAQLLRNPSAPYVPVALLDDDPAKANLQIAGVPVVGDRHAITAATRATAATALLIAIPSATGELVRDVSERAARAGLQVKVLPTVGELIDGQVGVADIRPPTDEDLLGRHQIDTDVDAIAGYLAGRRVLVTGAGGSIGSELCRQIQRFAPAALVMLDHDESALHTVQLSIDGRALLDSDDLVLADLRDGASIEQVFATHRPQVVFHAAALKHLTLLERHPDEGFRTNARATLDLLEMAAAHDVERFVNISTDKAADPTSVLGYTKRIAERLTSAVAEHAAGTFMSVRFGNVLGSRGSMLTTFRAQLAFGGPLTVTDPDASRYFMTVSEACQLVIQAGAIGRSGEALVLEMGEPVRIAEVARRLAEQSAHPIEIVHTGLRPGEKLQEQLFGVDERDHRPVHSLIAHVDVPPLSPEAVRACRLDPSSGRAAGQLQTLAALPAGASVDELATRGHEMRTVEAQQ